MRTRPLAGAIPDRDDDPSVEPSHRSPPLLNQMVGFGRSSNHRPHYLSSQLVGCIVIAIKAPAEVSSTGTKEQKQVIENLKEKEIVEGL